MNKTTRIDNRKWNSFDYLVVGAGFSGAVVARELAEAGKQVMIWERRDHIAGNMYDYKDNHGCLVQKYGPHIFHTDRKDLFEYISKYEKWVPLKSVTGASWGGKYSPTPFNFKTIDTFYAEDDAKRLKEKLLKAFPNSNKANVLEVLEHQDPDIRGYAEFLFKNDYGPYTAKQWGIEPSEIDPLVLKRLPLRFSYDENYFDLPYEVLPSHSFTYFFEQLLNHSNIVVECNVDALDHLKIENDRVVVDGGMTELKVVYTGAIDELFGNKLGRLPYRSLRFEWKYTEEDSFQPAMVVAYPQEPGYTRITEYKKFLNQKIKGSSYAVEFPTPYEKGVEPYYPILTRESQELYGKYEELAAKVKNLTICGRLADFKYYDMDKALERALQVASELIEKN